jgi:heme/copper-type cytochrome/quinol oxidase subunit 3
MTPEVSAALFLSAAGFAYLVALVTGHSITKSGYNRGQVIGRVTMWAICLAGAGASTPTLAWSQAQRNMSSSLYPPPLVFIVAVVLVAGSSWYMLAKIRGHQARRRRASSY